MVFIEMEIILVCLMDSYYSYLCNFGYYGREIIMVWEKVIEVIKFCVIVVLIMNNIFYLVVVFIVFGFG